MTKKEPDIFNDDLPAGTPVFEIQLCIWEIEKMSSLFEEKNFDERTEAIDFIEFQVIDRIEELLLKTDQRDELILLKYLAEKVKSELEAIDASQFQRLQAIIRNGAYTEKEFKKLVNEYIDFDLSNSENQQKAGYDNLDLFINGLFPLQTMPEPTKGLEPEMVYFQKTPVRIVFELVEKAHFTKEDVFFDLGSGLGQATILVNLLAGVTAIGVEFEPAFCDYARDCAAGLNLSNVSFVNADARKADYSKGTIFFMYTPFKGEMLQEVLAILRKESLSRQIKVITYGPCTAEVALQTWLHFITPEDNNGYKLAVFSSF